MIRPLRSARSLLWALRDLGFDAINFVALSLKSRPGRPRIPVELRQTGQRSHRAGVHLCAIMHEPRVRLHDRGHGSFSVPLCFRGDGGRLSPHPSLQRDKVPNCRINDPATTRSDTKRPRVPISRSRSTRHVFIGTGYRCSRARTRRIEDADSCAEGECVLRAIDRNLETRMSGFRDSTERPSSPYHHSRMGFTLQQRSTAFQVRSGDPGSRSEPAVENTSPSP